MALLFLTPRARRLKTAARLLAGVLAIAVVVLTAAVAFTWAPDRSVAQLQPRWAPPPSAFVDVAGMKVHLRDEGVRGDPVPLVLLHGTSASLHTWDGWVHALEAQRRIIRVDLPGFGLTGPSPDGDYTMQSYVRFIAALLDKLDVGRAVLAGNSFGGRIAWNTALAMPARVDKLVLVDAGAYPENSTSVPIGFRIAKIPVLNRLALVTLPRSVIESSVRSAYGDPSKVTPALVDRYFELTLREGNRRALFDRFQQAPTGQNAAQIPNIKVPTLILWGGRDRLVLPQDAERFHRDIAGSQVVLFDDLGHVPHEEDPVRTAAAVKTFLGL